MSDILIPVAIILMMVAANALYVAAEFATVGARRSRVQEAAETGRAGARKLLAILKDPGRLDTYVAGCQIGITLSSLVAGAYGQAKLTPVLTPMLGSLGGETAAVIIVLILITVFQVVLGELLPKTVALRYPEQLSLATLPPMKLSLWLFTPLIRLFNGTALWIMRRMGMEPGRGHMHVHSPEELEGLYRESAAGGLIDATERDMLAGVLNVDQRLVRQIMTPRTRLVTVAGDQSVGEALKRLVETPFSRFPVTQGGGEDIVGTVHLRTLFTAARQDPSIPVTQVMRPPLVVADLMTVPRLWQSLRDAARHSALVVNEYGIVVGMVTLEDALEEIFGEMQDEFDQELEPIDESGQTVLVRGDVLVTALNTRFGLTLPDEDVDTVGGLVWHMLGRLPVVGDVVDLGPDQPRLRVEAMERLAVSRVSLLQAEHGDD